MARRGNKQALALVKTTRAMKRLRLLRSGSAFAAAIAMAGLTASPVAAQMAPGAGMTPNPRAVIVERPVETPRPTRPGSPIMSGPQVPRISLQGQAEPIRLLTPDDIRISGSATLDPPTIAAPANRARPSAPTMVQDIRISGAATLSPPMVEDIRISGAAVLPPSTVEDVRITTPAALPPAASPQPTEPVTPPNQIAPATSGVAGINVLAYADFDGSKIGYTPGDAVDIVSVNAAEAIINWTTFGSGAPGSDVTFLGEGSTLAFTSGLADYTVLNRVFTPAFDSAIRIDGSVTSTVAGGATGGNVWFYSAGGIIVGSTGAFDVGSLVLTTSQLDAISAGGTQLQFGGVTTASSGITIEKGATINAGDYVALVAPRIEQHGTVSADGSVAYVAAEQAQLTIDNGLFDIAVTVGSEDANGLVHSGTTTGGAAVSGGDPRSMQMVGVSKNSAMTMLVGGNIGYQAATGATVGENGQIILTAGGNDSFEISNANLSGDVTATAGNSISFVATAGGQTTADGNVSLKAGVDGVSGGSISVRSNGEMQIGGNLALDASVAGTGAVERGTISVSVAGEGAALSVGGDLLVDASTIGAVDYSAADVVSISVEDTGASGGLLVAGDIAVDTSAAAGSEDIATRAGGVSVAVRNGALSFDRMVVDSQASATGTALGQNGDGRDYQGGSFTLAQGEGAVINGSALVVDSSAAGVDGKGGRGAGGSFDIDVSGGVSSLDLVQVTNNGFGGNGARLEGGSASIDPSEPGLLGGSDPERSFASRSGLIPGQNAPQDTGFPSAGDGGDGVGGTNTFTLSAGVFNVADYTLQSNGIGSDGASGSSAGTPTNGGAGGDGIGGIARFVATGGTLNVTNTLTVSATGNTQADQGVGGLGNGSNGGDGGQGIGGSATFLLDGTATITADTILVDASAYGGAGAASITRPFLLTTGFDPADNAGSGGNATGGTAVFTDNAGTLSFNSLVVAADAIAGNGGIAQTGGADPSEGGNGGNAQAGNATINFNRAVNNDHDYFVIARAAGGIGGSGDIAGNGGNAVGGNATINVNNVAVGIDTAFVDTLAVGGAGGSAAGAGQAGGSGGNARAGTSAINVTGAGADFSSIGNVTINAVGIGGDGGAGGPEGGTGGVGGLGIGGAVEVTVSNGANATLKLDDEINASGTGGDGGAGGDSTVTAPSVGGAAGNAFGGSISLTAENGGTLAIEPSAGTVILDVTADGGFGGRAGAGPLGSTFTQGVNGAASGGAVDILVDGAGSAITAAGLVIADASATTDDDTRENSTGALARGGDISVRARDSGSLSFTSGLNFDASASGGSATRNAGTAIGGNATLSLVGATAVIDDISIDVAATGGAGLDGVFNVGSDGGDATGGTASISVDESSTLDSTSIFAGANADGGVGATGDTFFAGGDGGTGTAGTVSVSLLGTVTTLSDLFIRAVGTGGSGGLGGGDAIGGAGGDGQGGNVTTVFGGGGPVIPTLADYFVDVTGVGGNGGIGGIDVTTGPAGTGGAGGDGTGGIATLAIAGAGTTLDFDAGLFVINADGVGGTGGTGGSDFSGEAAGDGGDGGDATGGEMVIEAASGAIATLPTGFTMTLNAVGGAGGTGGDIDMATGGIAGSGGTGGTGTGGSPTLRAVGGTITGTDVQLVAVGTGGDGGTGGGDGLTVFGTTGNGGVGVGGTPTIETFDGSPGIITLGNVTIDASGIGGGGNVTGSTGGGQISIIDASADPLGLISMASLTVTANGAPTAGTPSLTIGSDSGPVTITNNLSADVADDIVFDLEGDGQLVVGSNAILNAGGDILLTHTGNTTPVNSLDIGSDFTATANGNFAAGDGSRIVAAREVSITAQNIGFDVIGAGDDNIFDAGEFALTLNATNGSIIGGALGDLTAIAGVDLDATQAISVGDVLITDGPITIDAGTTLTAGDIDINQGGLVSGESIVINAGGDTILGAVEAIDTLTVTSGGALTADSLIGVGVTANAAGAVDIGLASIFNGVANGQNITISGTSIILDSADASTATGAAITLDATAGDVTLGTINAEQNLTVTATGDITFDTLTGLGVFLTTTGGNVTGTTANTDRAINSGTPRDVQIVATGDVAVSNFSTINDVQITAASFDTDSIITGAAIGGNSSNIIVNVTGNAEIGFADVRGTIDVDAATMTIGDIAATNTITLDSTVGAIAINSIIADQNIVVNSATDILLGRSEKRGTDTLGNEDMEFTAAGNIVVTGVIDGHDSIVLDAGGAVDAQQLIAFDNVTVTAGTTADIAGITTTNSGNATITAQTIDLGLSSINGALTANATAGNLVLSGDVSTTGAIDLDATDDISFTTLTTTSSVDVNAGGNINGGSSLKTGTDSLGNESMSFTAGGDVVISGTVDTHDSVVIDAGGLIDASSLVAFDNITATAIGSLVIDQATITNTGAMTVFGQSVTIGRATLDGGLNATATGGDVDLLSAINSDGASTFTATGDINFVSVSGEGNKTFNAGGNVTGVSVSAGINDGGQDSVTIDAGGNLTITGTIFSLDGTFIDAVGELNIADIQATDGIVITAGGAAVIDNIATLTNDAALITGTSVTLNTGDFAGSLTINATAGDIFGTGAINVANSITLDATANINFGSLDSGNNFNADAGGNINFTSATATNSIDFQAGGDIIFGSAVATVDVDLVAGGLVDGDVVNGRIVTVNAGSMDIGALDATFIVDLDSTVGDIVLGTLDTPATANLLSAGQIQLGTANTGVFTGNAASEFVVQSLTSTGNAADINITAGTSATYTSIDADRLLRIDAATINGGSVNVDASLNFDAGTINVGDITVDELGNVILASTVGGITVGEITNGNIVNYDSAGALNAGVINAGTTNLAASGNATLTDINTGSLTINVTGDLDVGAIAGSSTVAISTVTVGGGADIGSMIVNNGLRLNIGGALTGGAFEGLLVDIDSDSIDIDSVVSTTGAAIIDATNAVDIGMVGSALNTAITGSSVTLDSGTIGTSLALNATGGDVAGTGNIAVTNDINLDATGNIGFGTLDAGAGFTADAGGDITFTSASSGDALTFNAGTAITGGNITSGSTLNLAAPSIDVGILSSAAALTVNADDILIDEIDNGTDADVTLTSTGAIEVGDIVGRIVTADAGTDLTLGNVDAIGRDIRGIAIDLDAGGTATFGDLISGRGIDVDAAVVVGGNVTSDNGVDVAADSITIGNVNVTETGGVVLDALAGDLVAGDLTSTIFNVIARATGSVTTGDLSVNGTSNSSSISVDAGGDANIGNATAGSGLFVTVDGNLTSGSLSSNRVSPGTVVTVLGDADIGSFDSALGSGTLNIGGALTGGAFAASSFLTIDADSIDIVSATSDSQAIAITANNGDAVVGSTNSALGTTVTATGLAQVGNAVAGRSFTIRGTSAVLNSGTITDDLTWEATGGDIDGSGAISVGGAIDLDATGNIGFGSLDAQGGAFNVDAGGDITFTAATSTASLTFNAVGAINGGDLTATNTVSLDGGSIALGDVVAGTIDLTSATNILFNMLQSPNAISLTALGGTIGANTGNGDIDSGDSVTLNAAAIAVGTVDAQTSITATATGAASIDNAISGTFTSITGSSAALNSGTIGTDLTLNSTAGDIDGSGAITVGGAIDFDATGNIGFGSLDAQGGILAVNAGGDINYVSANASLDVNLVAGGAITGGTATSDTRSVRLTGTSINVGDTNAANDVLATSTAGSLIIGDTTAGNNLLLNSQSSLTTGDLRSTGGRINLDAIGAMTLGAVSTVDTDITLDAGGDITFASIDSGRLVDVVTTGAVSGGDITSQLLISVDAGSIAVGNVSSITDTTTLVATGNIEAAGVASPSTVTVSAGGIADIGTASSGGNTFITGASVVLDSGTIGGLLRLNALAGDIDGSGAISVGGAIDFDATGNIGFGSLDAQGGAFNVDAGGDITFTAATSTASMSFTAIGAINGGDLTATNAISLNGGDIAIGDANADALNFTSATNILFDSLTSPNAISLTALGGTIGANTGNGDITSGDSVTLDATAIAVGTVDAQTSITASATGAASINNAISGTFTSITGSSAVLNSGTIGTDLTLNSTAGDVDGSGAITVGGAIDFDATGNVGFGSLDAQGGAFNVDAGGDITFTAATSTDSLTFNAVGAINGGDLAATNTVLLDANSIALGDVIAGTIDLTSATNILFNLLQSPNAISLTATGGLIGANTGDGDIDSDGNVTLTAQAIDLGAITAGGIVEASASAGDASFGTINSDGGVTLAATAGSLTTGDVTVANLGAAISLAAGGASGDLSTGRLTTNGGDILASAGNNIALVGAATSAGTPTSGTIALLAGGNIAATGSLSAGEDVAIRSLGNVTLGTVGAGDDVSVNADGTVATGAITSTGTGIDLFEISFNTQGAGQLGSIAFAAETLTGSNIQLGGVSITGTNLDSANDIIADATAGDISFTITDSVGATTFSATGNISVDHADAGGNFSASGNGDFTTNLNSIITGGDIVIAMAGAVDLGNSSAGGLIDVQGSQIDFASLAAGLTVDLVATGAINGGTINGDGTVTLNAATIAMGDLTTLADVDADATGGDASFGVIDAGGAVNIVASGTPTIGGLTTGGGASITGDSITLGASHIGGGLFLDAQAGSILLQLDGAEQILVGGSTNLNAAQNITITHTNNAGGTISLDSAGGISASAFGGNIDAQAGSILSGTELILLASGSISADDLRAVPGIVISAGGNVALNNAIVAGPQGVSNFRGITIDAGQDPFGSTAYDNFSNVQITGTVDSYADITVRAGGNVLFDAGSTTVADDSLFVQTGDDIIVAAGASLISGRNPSVAPDPGEPFIGTASIILSAGGNTNLLSVPATPIASLVVDGTLDANGGAIIASANAIDGLDGNFIASSIALDINDAPGAGGFQDDDAGLLSANCFEGNICVGNIVADNVIEIGQASNNDVIQLIIEQGTVNANDILITTRNDIVMGTNGIATALSAANLFSATSTTGDVNLFDADISSGQIVIDAAGSLLGTATLTSTNDIGITVGGDVNANSIITDGELTSAADVGGALEGAFSVPGTLSVGTISVGAGAVNYSAGDDILIGTLVVPGTDAILSANGLVSLDQYLTGTGLTVTANELILSTVSTSGSVAADIGTNASLGQIFANGDIQVDAGGTISAVDLTAGGTLRLNGGLIAIGDASATDIDLTSASDILFNSLTSPNSITLDAMAGRIADNGGNGDIDSDGDVSLLALEIAIGNVLAGGSVTADAISGDASFANVDAVNDITITATGTPTLDSLSSGGNTSITGASVTLDNAVVNGDLSLTATTGDIDGSGNILVDGGIAFDAAGNVGFGSLDALGGQFTVTAGGDISFTAATSNDFIDFAAGGAINGGDLTATNDLSLDGNSIAIGDASAANIAIISATDILFNSLMSPNAINLSAVNGTIGANTGAGDIDSDGDITLLAQTITLGDVVSGGSISADATNGDASFGTVDAANDITITASGTPTIGNAISGGNTSITGSSVTFNNGTIGGDLSLTATGGDIDGNGTVNVGGGIAFDAAGNVTFGSLDAQGGAFEVDAVGTITFTSATAADFVRMQAGTLVQGGSIDAGTTVNLISVDIDVSDVVAGGDIDALADGGNLTFDNLDSGGTITLGAVGNVFADHAEAAGDFISDSGGNFTTGLNSIITGGDILITGDIVDLGNSNAGGLVDVTGSQIDFVTVIAGQTIALETIDLNAIGIPSNGNGNITGVDMTAGAGASTLNALNTINLSDQTIIGGSLTMDAGAAIALNSTDVNGGDFFATAGTTISAGETSAAGTVDLLAAGDIQLTNDLESGDEVFIDSLGGSIAGLNIEAESDVDIGANGTIDLADITTNGGGVSVSTGGNITLGSVTGAGASGIAVTSGAGSLTFVDMQASGGVSLLADTGALTGNNINSGGEVSVDGDTVALNDVVSGDDFFGISEVGGFVFNSATSAGEIFLIIATQGDLGTLDAATDITVQGGGIGLGQGTAGGNITLTTGSAQGIVSGDLVAGGDILIDTGSAGFAGAILDAEGALQIDSGGDVGFDTAESGLDMGITSVSGSVTGTSVFSGADIDIDAGNEIVIGSVIADQTGSGSVTLQGDGGITLNRLGSNDAALTAPNGAISVDQNIVVTNTVVADGQSVFLRAINDLRANANATAGGIDIEAGGPLDIQGANATGGIALASTGDSTVISQQVTSTGGDISISGATDVLIGQNVNAGGNLAVDAGNLVDVQALASGVLIDISSSDITIGSTGSIGESDRTTSITFTANADEVTLGGAGGSGTPYEIDNDEFSRVFSGGDVTLNAIGFATGGAAVTIDDLDVVAGVGANATDGNIGQGGGLFVIGGTIDIIGEAVVTNAAADTTLGLTASGDIFLDAATGLLEVQVDTGDYTGSILIEAENFYAMTADALADIQGLGIAEIDARLADSDGLDNAEGVIRAGTLDITTIASDVFIQHTALGTEFDERRGFTVDQLIISDLGNDPQPIVINGVIAGTTGIDAIPLADIGSNFDPGSTINGCLIADPASCIVTTIDPTDPGDSSSENPVRDLIEEQIEPENPAGESVLSMIIEFREDPERAPDPLIDEPVTGAGNEDLWFVEESEEEGECTEADPELCPAE